MADWQFVDQITVTPDTISVDVGSFSMGDGDDTVWVDVQRVGGDSSWPWSYGLLSWRTAFGYELGSVKAYTELSGEVFRLGVGRAPRSRDGVLTYEPRSYNRQWIKRGNPLTLSFSAVSGVTAAAPVPTTAGSIAMPVDGGTWQYQDGLVQLKF